MGMESLEESALRVYEAFYAGRKSVKVEVKKCPIRSTSNLGLEVVYTGEVRFLEQNPEKDSRWGRWPGKATRSYGSSRMAATWLK